MNKYKENLLSILLILFCFIGSLSAFWKTIKPDDIKYSKENMKQPEITIGVNPWSVRSIDTQVISKHWLNVSRESIKEQVDLIKSLGANYVAIGTPYDRADDMRLWVDEIHNAGMNVWFRSHWNEWEGDEGQPSTLKAKDYLDKTYNFIKINPDLFHPGDSFTMCVEAEQVGVGLGKRFLNWDEYKVFLLDQIYLSNQAFSEIGLKGKIHTNWLSTNGWVVENIFDEKLVSNIGLITVDHFVGQTNTIGGVDDSDELVEQTINDLNMFHNMFDKPIFLGEWGYQIYQNVPDVRQANVINKMYSKLQTLDYLIGTNYWVHMGNTSSLFGDESGSNITPRFGAEVIKHFYTPTSAIEENIGDRK